MKILPATVGLVAALVFFSANSAPASPETNLPAIRLTVELRDGSRVIGQNISETIKFQSVLLGQLKLAVKDLRLVECLATNAAKLTTVNGDTLTVTFSDAQLNLKTGFGKIQLAVDSIRKITVSPQGSPTQHPGLVARWSGEDNGQDSSGNHNAELTDIAYADGKVGRAFSLDGFNSWMKIPGHESLDVGKGDGFTISAWIKPGNVMGFHPILEWEVTRQKNAVSLWLGHQPQDRGVLFCNLGDDRGNTHSLCSAPGAVASGRFQQVALTYDKTSGIGRLFLNGRIVAQQNLGIFTPDTTGPLFISRRPCDQPGDWTYDTFFDGLLDEITIYNRALSPTEIQAACQEDNHGDMTPAPSQKTD